MADPAEENISLKKLFSLINPETAGYIAEINKNFAEMNGVLQKIDAQVASGTAIAKFFAEFSGRFVGDLPDQLITFYETLRKSAAGNEEFVASLKKYRDEVISIGKESARFGISTKDNLLIMREMTKENLKLLPIYRENTKALVDFSSRMKAFGVETNESNSILKSLAGNLDFTGDQLDETRRKLVTFAKETKQGVSEVMKDYSANINKFMDFLDPQEMNKAFTQFQVMARRMNTETGTLFSLSEKFDTIESAQETGARMNQVFSSLGIEFNAMVLQDMEPRARIDYISSKVREGLKKARTLDPKGGRMIMGALRTGLGVDAATIRALEAEGGMSRATSFERMGGGPTVSRLEEAEMARRENATRVDKAMAEERQIAALLQSPSFQKIEGAVLTDFGGKMLKVSEKFDPVKDAGMKAFADAAEQKLSQIVTVFDDVISGARKLDDLEKKFLEENAMTPGGMQNVQTLGDLLNKLNSLDGKKLQDMLGNKEFYTGLANAIWKALGEALKDGRQPGE